MTILREKNGVQLIRHPGKEYEIINGNYRAWAFCSFDAVSIYETEVVREECKK